ncbi:MAG: DUF982 domain-containing protein [Mesorhizobium sp.]
MDLGWFSKPVTVAEGIVGDFRHIMNASEALELLTGRWRERGSDLHRGAVRACRFALNGNGPAESARTAFEAAALEARVLVD